MGVVLAGVAGVAVIREVQFGEPREEPGNGELDASHSAC
jgi:hypothetical protein